MRHALAAALLTSLLGAAAAAEPFALDPARTRLGFHADTIVVGVDGTFSKYKAELSADPQTLGNARASLTIEAASVASGYDMRDDHIRSRDLLDVKRYPRITFTSQRVERKGDQLLVTGALQLHGVRKTLTIPFTATRGKVPGEWELRGSATIDRRDFHVGVESVIKEKAIKDAIRLDLTLVGAFK